MEEVKKTPWLSRSPGKKLKMTFYALMYGIEFRKGLVMGFNFSIQGSKFNINPPEIRYRHKCKLWARQKLTNRKKEKEQMLNPYTGENAETYENLSEHEHQRELFSWVAAARLVGREEANTWAKSHPLTLKRSKLNTEGKRPLNKALEWIHAIPNGGNRGGNASQRAREGSRLRSEGVRRGIPDVFLPMPMRALGGLYIELKRPGGKRTQEQIDFSRWCQGRYEYCMAVGYWEAIEAVVRYVKLF